MINLKETIVNALMQLNAEVYFLYAPLDNLSFPFIIYREEQNRAWQFADNAEATAELVYVIDIYCKGSTSTLTNEVNEVMTQLGFLRTLCKDVLDPTECVQHKTLRFEQNKIIE